MGTNKEIEKKGQDLFVRYADEISKACERAVREALLRHKRAGNPVAISRGGKVVILQPDEINLD